MKALRWLGLWFLVGSSLPGWAVNETDSLRQLLAGSPPPDSIVHIHHLLFDRYYNQGTEPDSIRKYGHLLLAASQEEGKNWRIRGKLLQVEQQPDSAAQAFFKALKIAKQADNRKQMARIMNDLGSMFQLQRRPKQSKQYFLQASTIMAELGNNIDLADSYLRLANA